ncbi:DsbA family protein [Streptomyces caatingaensis]|uniref:Membrane protein n=1 Tax=Streptomyces caatingaensis TaxID=1678637 RepID=A0A0K9XHZ6_9ACTN|nr:thioredoxin domain-containing protein [Streptomyces caatingaensis]KNB52656.1 membrane protein [Streptomyces caatingaensis]
MSQKNTDGKRTARERLQEQRLRDEARDRRRRALIAGAVVLGVLGAGGGVAALVAGSGGKERTAAAGPAVPPQGALGKDGSTIPVGKKAAKATLTVYEDFRCPACALFENAYRETIHDLEDEGKLRTEYHIVTLIDKNLGGKGSLTAANAAACAQDAGKFSAYHDVLYKNQPPETNDAFAATSRLYELAGQVPGLNTPGFQKCVDDGTHESWVRQSHEAFRKLKLKATPTVLLNGKSIYGDPAHPLTSAKLREMTVAAAKGH